VTLGPETAVVASRAWCCGLRFASPTTRAPVVRPRSVRTSPLRPDSTDLVALVVLVGLPLAVFARSASWLERGKFVVVLLAVVVLVVAPWAGRNLATFSRTTLVSNDTGAVLAGANCATTYAGPLEGWWSRGVRTPQPPVGTSPRWPPNSWRRGATMRAATKLRWSAWRPSGSAGSGRRRSDRRGPARGPDRPTGVGHRAGDVVPLPPRADAVFARWCCVGAASCSSLCRHDRARHPHRALAYGDARFRVEADAAMAILAGVALDSLWRASSGRRARPVTGSATGRHAAGSAPRAVEHESPVRPAAGVVAAREGR